MPTNPISQNTLTRSITHGDVEFGDRQYLSAEHLAQRLRVSVRTLARWNARRIGPPQIKIGKRVLYDQARLPEWLTSRETESVRGRSRSR